MSLLRLSLSRPETGTASVFLLDGSLYLFLSISGPGVPFFGYLPKK